MNLQGLKMYLKNILTVFLSIIFIFLSYNLTYAASRILQGEFSSLEGRLILLADVNKEKRLITVDLRTCTQQSSIKLDNSIKQMIVSEYLPGYIAAGGSRLMIYNIADGKVKQSFDDFIRPVNIISQSDMGEYIAASDGVTVGLYQFQKNGLVKLFTKEFSGSVASVFPDIESNTLYVSERSGKISVWSFSGKLEKNINMELSISALTYDEKTGSFLASTGKGLYSLNKDTFAPEKILNGKILSVMVEEYSSRLQVMTNQGYTVYDYPAMRAVINLEGINGSIIKSNAPNVAAVSGLNYIRLYDLKKNIHTATIAVDSLGMVNFFPPSMEYGSNISSSFIAAAANSKEEKQAYNKDRVCAPVAAMVAGVYMPDNLGVADVKVNEINDPYAVNIPDPAAPKQVNSPVFTFKSGNLSVPEVKDNTKVSEVKFNEHKSNVTMPLETSDPKSPKVKDIGELVSSQIPSWVANRKNLPKNNAVASAGSEDAAVINARKILKNNLVKESLTSIIKDESLKPIVNTEGRQRVLWQSAAKAVNSMKILTVDTWKSPAGQFYLHVIADDAALKAKTKELLKEEINNYLNNGYEKYMNEQPVSIE